jgi:predicted CXXCH cytochrome family protein
VKRARRSAALLAAAVAAAACRSAVAPPGAPPSPARADPSLVTSNVLRADYAGSKACEPCHAAIYARWAASPMRRMTRLAPEAQIHAPFDGTVFRFKGDRVTMEEHDGRKYMRLDAQRSGSTLYRVTKVIGGRYREDFAGYEISGTEANALPVGNPHQESVLPASYLLFSKTWRYKGYSVMVKERPYIEKGGAPWRQTCIFCHNTAPYLATVYDDLLGSGAKSYQGSVSDRLLPEGRLWKLSAGDEAGLTRALSGEIAYLQGKPPKGEGTAALLAEAIQVTGRRFGQENLVEVGIGCEACHNGSREHVVDPRKKPTFAIRSPAVSVSVPGGREPAPAELVNRTCARCHTVLFSRYPFTWEGGQRAGAAGGSTINSGEARDFLLGGCSSQMSCADCHDPHAEDGRQKLDELGTVAGNRVCVRCHDKYAPGAALAAHTHHAPAGEGSACLNCHMPRKNTGLGYRLTRYHRIGSPSDKDRVEKDRPLECAICHADKTAGALLETMERWWKKSYDRGAVAALYGSLDADPLVQTLSRGKPHEQIAAAALLGERGSVKAAPAILPLLSSEYPLVRYYARSAIEALLKRPMPVDLDGDPAAIQNEASAWLGEALPK